MRRPRHVPRWQNNLPATLLDAFCRRHGIGTPQLAAASHVNRQHLARVRAGHSDVTIRTAKMIALGATLLCGRLVAIGELFDLTVA